MPAWRIHGTSDYFSVVANNSTERSAVLLIPLGGVDADLARMIYEGASRNGGVARGKRDKRDSRDV
jgi:hypothetical protein